ncbi:MAG TPA: hypothetical protein VHY83_01905 [Solirubrobacteraceae bacterium]|jgi:hypothetical protein|nr:hypothetical protein [Solirubrobacteraceae bacterium]
MKFADRSRRQKALVAAALAALVAGATVAVVAATDGGSSPSTAPGNNQATAPVLSGDLKLAVTYLGVSGSGLLEALRSGRTLAQVADATPGRSATGLIDSIVAARKAALRSAVAAGGLTAAQERTALASLRSRVGTRVRRAGGYPGAVGRLPLRTQAAAAAYLGVSPAKLRAELRAGQSLAQVANATPGKSASGLIASIVADRKARIAAQVASGGLTAARQKLLVAKLEQRVAAEVNAARP